MAIKTKSDKSKSNYPWTARQKRRLINVRQERKKSRKGKSMWKPT